MSRRFRLRLFLLGAIGLVALYLRAASEIPPAGRYRGPYGDVLNRVATVERHATDVVTAVNFDYRAIDTLGEELILFTSVLAVAVLLRRRRGDRAEGDELVPVEPRATEPDSDAVRAVAVGVVGVNVAFGLYVVTHGQVSPGGGFQGGVVLASAPLLVYLAARADRFLRIAPPPLVEASEALGILAFLAVGLLGYFGGSAFLENVLPLGPVGKVDSSGTIPLVSLATGLEVSAAFVFLLTVFVEETLRPPRGDGASDGARGGAA